VPEFDERVRDPSGAAAELEDRRAVARHLPVRVPHLADPAMLPG
jgi:hypothetical protein